MEIYVIIFDPITIKKYSDFLPVPKCIFNIYTYNYTVSIEI